MMRVHFIFSNGRGLFRSIGSAAIRKAEGTKFSHASVGIELNMQYGRKFWIFESVYPKSRVVTLEEWNKHYQMVESISFEVLGKGLQDRMQKRLMALRFLPYSLVQCFLIFLSIISKPFGLWSGKRNWNGETSLICSEMVALFLMSFFDVDFKEKSDTISLQDVHRVVVDLKEKEKSDVSIWLP